MEEVLAHTSDNPSQRYSHALLCKAKQGTPMSTYTAYNSIKNRVAIAATIFMRVHSEQNGLVVTYIADLLLPIRKQR